MTAIEWLAQAFITNSEVTGINNNEWVIKEGDLDRIVKQAKEMHKEEIVQAYSNGWHDGQDIIINSIKHIDIGGDQAGEIFYNETYKNKNNDV